MSNLLKEIKPQCELSAGFDDISSKLIIVKCKNAIAFPLLEVINFRLNQDMYQQATKLKIAEVKPNFKKGD